MDTINTTDLVPIFCEETLPGDLWDVQLTILARFSTPIQPLMDRIRLDTHFFSIANRLVWENWPKFMGEQDNPADSINFTIPQVVSAAGGFVQNSIFDHFGLPCTGQIAGANTLSVNALPLRAYNLVVNQYYRDENLDNALIPTNPYGSTGRGNGPDAIGNYALFQRRKPRDRFTSLLPWPQKGGTAITVPLVGNPPIRTSSSALIGGAAPGIQYKDSLAGGAPVQALTMVTGAAVGNANFKGSTTAGVANAGDMLYPANLYADFAGTSAVTIAALRIAITQQQFLELDARAGTRYPESIHAHFDVISPDSRMQRAEYIGGGSQYMQFTEVPQTSGTGASGTTNPLGTLGAFGKTVGNNHRFRCAITEHGYILGLISAITVPTYQQGLRDHWTRSVRFDYPYPIFAGLGEQPVLTKRVFCDGSANDNVVLGYEPRFEEMRNLPSEINGKFRSNHTGTLDAFHVAEDFAAAPGYNSTFITDQTKSILVRNLTLGASAANQQLLLDMWFEGSFVRALPAFGTPGLTRL